MTVQLLSNAAALLEASCEVTTKSLGGLTGHRGSFITHAQRFACPGTWYLVCCVMMSFDSHAAQHARMDVALGPLNPTLWVHLAATASTARLSQMGTAPTGRNAGQM